MTVTTNEISPAQAARELLKRRKARRSFIDFIEYTWQKPFPFIRGKHTVKICAVFDKAVDDYLKGKSSYLDISVAFRHGKSAMVSRYFPPYFLARTQARHPDVIMTGYGASLVEGFSKDAKRIIESPQYEKLFPEVIIPRGEDSVQEWGIEGSTGRVTAAGLGGAMTGKGGDLIIIDDYCKSRKEARSEAFRQKIWETFTNEIMTRRPAVCIIIVCATRWHIDDLSGRIEVHEGVDEHFPKFKRLKFPARQGKGYLFEKKFGREWYESQYATLGKKWAAGLMDCDPVQEGGNRFDVVEGVNVFIHDNDKDFPEAGESRCWDLASTKKERDKDDPDYTVGVRGCVVFDEEDKQLNLWARHAVFGQWEAPERNRTIRKTAQADGAGVHVWIEAFGAYKDSFIELKKILSGQRIVKKSILPGDKSSKCADLEPIFEAGNVHLLRGDWNDMFLKHFREFPDGAHDDFCDATAILYHESQKPKSTIIPVA